MASSINRLIARVRTKLVRLSSLESLVVEASALSAASFMAALTSEWIADSLSFSALYRLLVIGAAYVIVGTGALVGLRYIQQLREAELGSRQALLGTARALTDACVLADLKRACNGEDDSRESIFSLLEALHETFRSTPAGVG